MESVCFVKPNSFHEMGFMPYRASLELFCHLLNSITSGRNGRDPSLLLQGGVVGGGEKMTSGERIDGPQEARVCQCPANDHLILVHGFVNNASCCWSRFLSSQVRTEVVT